MRTILLAGFAAAGIQLLGMSNTHAAPANASVIGRTADFATALQDAAWYIRRKCWRQPLTGASRCSSWRVWRRS